MLLCAKIIFLVISEQCVWDSEGVSFIVHPSIPIPPTQTGLYHGSKLLQLCNDEQYPVSKIWTHNVQLYAIYYDTIL